MLDDHESCDSMNELMLPSFGQLQSPNKLPSLGLKASSTSNTYGSFLENDQNMFEGMITNGTNIQGSMINNSPSSFPSTTANLLSLKPSFPTSNLYWNNEEGTTNTSGAAGTNNCSSSSSKRFVMERGDHENVSFPSLLIQFPQNSQASIHEQAPSLGGTIGDQGVVRHHEPQSFTNWYSHI